MTQLVAVDEDFNTSPVFIGYLILKKMKRAKSEKISIFEIIDFLKNEIKIVHYRQFVFSLLFLYSLNVVDFEDPYLYLT